MVDGCWWLMVVGWLVGCYYEPQVKNASSCNAWLEHIKKVAVRLNIVDMLLSGIIAMTTLESDFGVVNYLVASQTYLEWQQGGTSASKQSPPYLCRLMEYCDCKLHLVNEKGGSTFQAFEDITTDMFGELLPGVNADLGEVLNFSTISPVAARFSERHCHEKLSACVEGFMASLCSGLVTLANKVQLQDRPVNEQFDALVSMSPANPSSAFHDEFGKFVVGDLMETNIASLSHVRMLKVVQTMVSRVCDRSLFSPALQQSSAPCIGKGALHHLLDIHVAVHTVVLLASWLVPQLSSLAEDARPASELVEAGRLLGQSLRDLESLLASPSSQELESQKLALKQNIALFSEWHSGMKLFMESVSKYMKTKFCQFVIKSASNLQSSLPTWKLFISDDKINETMAKQKVLNNPAKASINPACDGLQRALVDTVQATVVLGLAPAFELDEECTGAKAVADSAANAAYQCLAVTAALNALYNLKGKKSESKVAQSVLDIVKGMAGFSLPKVVENQLKAMVSASSDTFAVGSAADGEHVETPPPKKRRRGVKVEPHGSEGLPGDAESGSVAAATVKREPAC